MLPIKYGLMMDLPEGKIPGYYSQIVKALGTKANLFDRDKELLITSTEQERSAAIEVLRHFKIPYEEIRLIHLPDSAQIHSRLDDFGFKSRADHQYLYEDLVTAFHFTGDADQERNQALTQMSEHIIASYEFNGEKHFCIEKAYAELIAGIAKAYKCSVVFSA